MKNWQNEFRAACINLREALSAEELVDLKGFDDATWEKAAPVLRRTEDARIELERLIREMPSPDAIGVAL